MDFFDHGSEFLCCFCVQLTEGLSAPTMIHEPGGQYFGMFSSPSRQGIFRKIFRDIWISPNGSSSGQVIDSVARVHPAIHPARPAQRMQFTPRLRPRVQLWLHQGSNHSQAPQSRRREKGAAGDGWIDVGDG